MNKLIKVYARSSVNVLVFSACKKAHGQYITMHIEQCSRYQLITISVKSFTMISYSLIHPLLHKWAIATMQGTA